MRARVVQCGDPGHTAQGDDGRAPICTGHRGHSQSPHKPLPGPGALPWPVALVSSPTQNRDWVQG